MKNVLILGVTGQLGRYLYDLIPDASYFHGRITDTNFHTLAQVIEQGKFDVVINAIAYNDVDQAEQDPGQAVLLNAALPSFLGDMSKKHGAHIIHYSTDYVFDGEKKTPYTEFYTPNPKTVYGQTKLQGEKELQRNVGVDKVTIFRTSMLWSLRRKNLFTSLQRLLLQTPPGETLLLPGGDYCSSPTHAFDLANVTASLVRTQIPSGVFHAAGATPGTRVDFANLLVKGMAFNHEVRASPDTRAARRPKYSVLSSARLESATRFVLPGFDERLRSLFS